MAAGAKLKIVVLILKTFYLLTFPGCFVVGVEIRDMRVPRMIESGSQSHVILDCDYDLRETEGNQMDLKWYFRDDPQPFFQWLPGRPPQTIGKYRRILGYL